MEIRHLTESDDLLSVSRVYEQSWKYAYKSIIPKSYLDGISEGKWVKNISSPMLKSLIVLENDNIVGTASYCASRFSEMKHWGEIVSIYLMPEVIRKGYGKALLQAAVKELTEMGFKDIFLWVLEDNENARCFYEKFGFIQSGRFLNDNIGGKNLREMQYIYHTK